MTVVSVVCRHDGRVRNINHYKNLQRKSLQMSSRWQMAKNKDMGIFKVRYYLSHCELHFFGSSKLSEPKKIPAELEMLERLTPRSSDELTVRRVDSAV